MKTTVHPAAVATEGNEVASSFHVDSKLTAVRCWQEAVAASGVDDKVLASEARMSRGHYSKLASGDQGDLLGLAYRLKRHRPEIFRDFMSRLVEAESINPIATAAEQLAVAALRYLRLSGADLPFTMAKAGLHERAKAVNQ